MRPFIVIAVASLFLASCDLTSPPQTNTETSAETAAEPGPAGAFTHSQTGDLSGYYLPSAQVGPADFRLLTVFVGQAPEFRDWEDGRRSATFAPVMLEFAVPGQPNERILPDSYAVSDGRIRMTGTSKAHGCISFVGRLDQGALSTARRNLGERETPALVAAVTIDGRTTSGLQFAWSGGD